MKKDRLKPYVYKIEGAVNFALYNILKGKFYHFSPEGTVEEFRRYLLDEGLIFQTEGVVPNKITVKNMWEIQHKLNVRVLQIRLNGRKEDNCLNRKKLSEKKQLMNNDIIEIAINQCQYLPIDKIKIEAEYEDASKIQKLLTGFNVKNMELFIEDGITEKNLDSYKKICRDGNKNLLVSTTGIRDIKKLEAKTFDFFYRKYYNPCLGHQIALDTNGEIKSCLWSGDILGHIGNDNLKDLIIAGAFDEYWELGKEKIIDCKECELRFACDDCRVLALQEIGSIEAKPPFCNYNPHTGKEKNS